MATIGRRAAVAELPAGRRPPRILHGGVAWLAWLGLHLVYLVGVRNRVSVFANWAWNYLTWDRGPRLILRPEVLPHSPRVEPDAGPPPFGPGAGRAGQARPSTRLTLISITTRSSRSPGWR